MQIKDITIFGYGKMQNVTFENLGMLRVFYGENEAGKSTIMSFIHSLLFGFPTKQQNENRYEPKTRSAYGGKMTVATKDYGDVIIQRIKGKATGDVTVTYQDGRVGDEADLQLLLKGMDKATYQAVFSFDLEGLNHLHKLNENEVSRYLLSTGLLGSGNLLQAEQSLQKEMDRLFKPSGKNPTINVLLEKMKEYHHSLQQAEQEQNRYDELQALLKRSEEEKIRIEQQLSELEQNLTSSYHYKNVEPLILEEKRLQMKINQLGDVSLPADANARYEALQNEGVPIRIQLSSLLQQQSMIEEKLNHLQLDKDIFQEKEQIQKVIDHTASLQPLQHQLQQWEMSLEQKQTNIQQLKDYVHISLREEELLQLDTSAAMKQRITHLHKKVDKLQHDQQNLDERQATEEQILRTIEQRLDYLNEQVLEDEKRRHIEQQVHRQKNEQQSAMEFHYVEQSIQALEKRILLTTRNERNNKKNVDFMVSVVTALLVVGTIVFIVTNQFLIGALLAVLVIVLFGLKGKLRSASVIPELQQELSDLEKRRATLKGEHLSTGYDEMEVLLKKDDEVRQQVQNAQVKKAEHEASFNKIVDAYELWERETIAVKQEIAVILSQWYLPQQPISVEMLVSFYESISELKQHIYEKKHLMEKITDCRQEIAAIENEVWRYCSEKTESVQEAVVMLRNQLKTTERISLEQEQLIETKNVLKGQISDLTFQQQYIEQQLVQLYRLADCDCEETFLNKLALTKEKMEQEEKLARLQIQLKPYEAERAIWDRSTIIIDDYFIKKLEEQSQNAKQQREELLQRIVEIKHHLHQLEDGGTYDERSFTYAVKKEELAVEAKEWMKYALAKNMLQNAINMYKDNKFPQILQTAEQHLGWITDGEYIRLNWHDESSGLMLKRRDGIVFEAKEVSRGTQEAVYVSLRLALAQQSYENDSMPIIIDDSFVNFDWTRVQRIISLLHKIKYTHQLIFFTCHQYLLPLFEENEITRLQEEVHL